mgnify:CR=1 FL=1
MFRGLHLVPPDTRFDFMRLRLIAFVLSSLMVVGSIGLIAVLVATAGCYASSIDTGKRPSTKVIRKAFASWLSSPSRLGVSVTRYCAFRSWEFVFPSTFTQQEESEVCEVT